jgi:hypothetical protein
MVHKEYNHTVIFCSIVIASIILSGFSTSLKIPISPEAQLTNNINKEVNKNNSSPQSLVFIPNIGQADQSIRFLGQGTNGAIYFAKDVINFLFPLISKTDAFDHPSNIFGNTQEKLTNENVRLLFLNTNKNTEILGDELLEGKFNYFIGNDSNQWKKGIPTYAALKYDELYTGVDLYISGSTGDYKSTFEIQPGADPNTIKWKYPDATQITIDDLSKNLIIHIPGETTTGIKFNDNENSKEVKLIELAPTAWQEISGKQIPVDVNYKISKDQSLGFTIGYYDPGYPLFIDPIIEFSTYFGGSEFDAIRDLAVDADGYIYITGWTNSTDFPGASLVSVTSPKIFISKLNPDGQAIQFTSIIGGDGYDKSYGLFLDNQNYLYITGYTCSGNYPLVHPVDSIKGMNDCDTIITELSSDGEDILFSTYLGGDGYDEAYSITLDNNNNIITTGITSSMNFPTTIGAFDKILGGSSDAFLSKVNLDTYSLAFSTFLGGNDLDYGNDVICDSLGNIYLTGATESDDYPVVNPIQFEDQKLNQETHASWASDVIIAKFSSDGELLNNTRFGGNSTDIGNKIVFDQDNNIVVTGKTASDDMPTFDAIQDQFRYGDADFFLIKINPAKNQFVFSTYLGGIGDESGLDLAIDDNNNFYIGGIVSSCIPPYYYSLPSSNGAIVRLSSDLQHFDIYRTGGYSVNHLIIFKNQFVIATGHAYQNDVPMVNPIDSVIENKPGQANGDGFITKIKVFDSIPLLGYPVYIPIISAGSGRQPGISGRVLYKTCGISDIPLQLRHYAGGNWSTIATTLSQIDGSFVFTNIPTLKSGEQYYVLFQNSIENTELAASWSSPLIPSYISGEEKALNNAEISTISNETPANQEYIYTPHEFLWGLRYWVTSNYEFNLINPANTSIRFTSPSLGNVRQYRLITLPDDFISEKWYIWYITDNTPDRGYIVPYYGFQVNINITGSNYRNNFMDGTASIGSKIPLNQLLLPYESNLGQNP